MVSEKHCNFLINTGARVRRRPRRAGRGRAPPVWSDKFGVTLEWEIRRIGVPAPKGRSA